MKSPLYAAISPCPNDTFMFYSWMHHSLSPSLSLSLADINNLNAWALEKKFPLIKISIATLLQVYTDYYLLPIGTALGFGCGPKLVARPGTTLEDIHSVATPGFLTTAHLLLERFLPHPEKIFCPYHQICASVIQKKVDAGLIIHETRFTFSQYGLIELMDLGDLWSNETQLPIPLGGLALKRDIPYPGKIKETLRQSLQYAFDHTDEILPFVLHHSQEKNQDIVRRHIDTFVTEESVTLSSLGIQAIECLLKLPQTSWMCP